MDIGLSLFGVILFLVAKQVVFVDRTKVEAYRRWMELPVDVTFVGFMLTVAQVPSSNTKNSDYILLGVILLMLLSIYFWKKVCSYLIETGTEIHFESTSKIIFLNVLNVITASAAIILPIHFLGAG